MSTNHLTDLEGEWEGIRTSVTDTDLTITFPFLPEANDCMKALPGAIFDAADKFWSVPISPEIESDVRDAIMTIRELFQREKHKAEQRTIRQEEMADMVLGNLQREFEGTPLILDKDGGDITVRFPYNAKAVAILRKIDGRRWDGNEKIWRLPADAERQIRAAFKALKKILV